ncbi:MAG: GNAT family N-acetyltransferase [Casimicrobiaceae bacterium]
MTPHEPPRLELVTLDAGRIESLLTRDCELVARTCEFRYSDEWRAAEWWLRMRRECLLADPAFAPWAPRALALRATGESVGHLNFHAPPGPPHLVSFAPGGIELGYEVFPPYRRRGYATEALTSAIAYTEARGVPSIALAIGVANDISQRIARGLGFVERGRWQDERNGDEIVFVRLLVNRVGRP